MQAPTPNELLVVQAQLGDRRALTELVTRWHEPVRRYVGRMVSDRHAVDDLGQQVWTRALRALPRLSQPDRFAPWLFTIARRSVMDWLAARYRDARYRDAPYHDAPYRHDDGDDRTVMYNADPVERGDHADEVLDRARVAEGLAGLPTREREVLILFYLLDLSLQECADVLQVPVGTVKSRLFKARQLLRSHLIEKGYQA